MQATTQPVATPTDVAAPSGQINTWRCWRTALAWLAACVVLPMGLVACGGSDSVAPTAATSVTAVIDAAGGTVTGPDGMQVIFPPGALNQATTIGIARSSAGAPDALDAYPVSGYVYELTPHDLPFNVPVTVRAPVGTAPDTQVFMASPGQPWMATSATVTNGMAEWQRSSFSWMYAGICLTPTSMVGDPYWCASGVSVARLSAVPVEAMTQTELPRDPANGAFGAYRVDQNADLQLSQFVRVPGNCSNVTVRFLRRRWTDPLYWWHPDVVAQTQVLPTQYPVMSVAGPGYITGTATVTVPFTYTDGGHNQFVMAASYDCPGIIRSPNGNGGFNYSWDTAHPRHTDMWGDAIMVEGNVPTTTVLYTVGGTVSGLTGTGLILQNNGVDNKSVGADGTFNFATAIASGAAYAVTVQTQPTGQACTVTNGSGTASANVVNVTVSCAAVSAAKAWQGAALIESGSGDLPIVPSIAMDPNGNAFAIWVQNGGGSYPDIWTNRYVASTGWELPTLMENSDTNVGVPSVAAQDNGNAIAVWPQTDGIRDSIWASRYVVGTGWSTPVLIETDNAGHAYAPSVAIDASGNAIAVWHQYDGVRNNIWANRYVAGGGWGTATLIETSTESASYPLIAVNGGGDAIVVWDQFDGARNNSWANRYVVGSGWGVATLIETENLGSAVSQSIAMDATGNGVAAWVQSDGTRYNLWANRYDVVTGWGTATLIENDNTGDVIQGSPVVMDGNGNAMVVWSQFDGTRSNVWANRYVLGSGWGGATLIETDNTGSASSPSIAMNASGDAVAVWDQSDGTRTNIWANRYTMGTGWGTASLIEADNTGDATVASVAMSANGNAVAVWIQWDGLKFNVWTNVYK